MKRVTWVLLCVATMMMFLSVSNTAEAQAPPRQQDSRSLPQFASLPDAPKPQSNPGPGVLFDAGASYVYHAGAFCGIGASTSSVANTPAAGCGAGITLLPLPIFFEAGVMAPQANRSRLTGYISLDGSIPLAPVSSRYLPMAIVGYSRLFETGHALDYGFALAFPRFGKQNNDGGSMRLELRDYWTFASPNQHNVMLRVGWMGAVSD